MTSTGWIILIIIVAVAVLAALLMGRKRPAAGTPPVAEAPAAPIGEPVAMVAPLAPIPDAILQPEPDADTSPAPVAPDLEPEIVVPVLAPATPAAAAPATDGGDDLRRLKGVGPKIVSLLHAEGITRYAQIAAWTDADLAAINAKLGSFAGRPTRDNWIDQARLLAAGDVAGYEAKYGKL